MAALNDIAVVDGMGFRWGINKMEERAPLFIGAASAN